MEIYQIEKKKKYFFVELTCGKVVVHELINENHFLS